MLCQCHTLAIRSIPGANRGNMRRTCISLVAWRAGTPRSLICRILETLSSGLQICSSRTGGTMIYSLSPSPVTFNLWHDHHDRMGEHGKGILASITFSLTLMVLGRGNRPCSAKFREKWPCSHNNNTALIKQISLVDTALVMANTKSFNSKFKKKCLWEIMSPK